LAPVQAVIVPVKEENIDYANKVIQLLKEKGLRIELSAGSETLSKRIREAEIQKIPYILIIGDKEEKKKNNFCKEKKKR